MQITETDVLIIGAGLTGLTLGYLLKESKVEYQLLEARNRIGGRIITVGNDNECPIEMGATWVGDQHQYVQALLKELEIDLFEQLIGDHAIYEQSSMSPAQLVTLPHNPNPSYRISSGSSLLIHKLADHISEHRIQLNEIVEELTFEEDHVILQTSTQKLRAKKVISTLPPHLLKNIRFNPALDNDLIDVINSCHTWMGDSIKIGLRFSTPFWREKGTSGTIFSNVGPITEFYDHSTANDSSYSLKGFLNGTYFSLSKEERQNMVLSQLRKYYGAKVDSFLSYEELVWRKEVFTFNAYEHHVLPHQNNGHSLFQKDHYSGKFLLAGAETSSQNPGYMEGAVRSAYDCFKRL